ncbi:MAG: Hpt domain-containing protein [Verrucomicrobia bacterium]|nr:Hpt domain-containing protein [Verrucomicrobiota bacterium]
MKNPLFLIAALRRRPLLAWTLFFYIPVSLVAAVSIIGAQRYTQKLNAELANGQHTVAVAGCITAFGEQISKSILLIEKSVHDKTSPGKSVYELQVAADRLDQTVNAFNDGSEVVAPDGVRFMVDSVTDEKALAVLQEMNVIWVGIKTRADAVVLTSGPKKQNSEGIPFTESALSEASSFVASQQTRLSEQALAFSRRLEQLANDRVKALETPRTALIGVAVISLLLLPGAFFINRVRGARNAAASLAAELGASQTKLEAQSQALSIAKAETDRIMETVQEGLLLIDARGIIGDYHSRELTSILRQEQLAGRSLLGILERLLSEKMFRTTKDYIDLLFDAGRKEKAVLKVNPLTDIEVNFPNPSGGFINRYLGFSFRRIVENGAVSRVFVAVRDITTQIELEKKLRDSEQHKDRQLDILLGIVHVAPDELEAFITLVETELDTINDTLRAEHLVAAGGQGEALRERLQTVFRCVHNLKGNAAVLKLTTFQKAADLFETKLNELLSRPVLTGDDFLSVVVAQAGLRVDLGDLKELRGKLVGLRQPVGAPDASAQPASAIASPAVQIGAGLRQLVADAARDLDKATTVTIDEYALHTVAVDRPALVRDVLIQLARNSLAHSVEPAPLRLAGGKPAVATLSVRSLPRSADGLVGIAFRDDGRGLDLEAIRTRAESAGLLAPGSSHAPADIARCIFAPGFSTAAAVGAHSGRGMGMDIVKSKVVDEAGGVIEVHSTPGQFCEFHLYFPSASAA